MSEVFFVCVSFWQSGNSNLTYCKTNETLRPIPLVKKLILLLLLAFQYSFSLLLLLFFQCHFVFCFLLMLVCIYLLIYLSFPRCSPSFLVPFTVSNIYTYASLRRMKLNSKKWKEMIINFMQYNPLPLLPLLLGTLSLKGL